MDKYDRRHSPRQKKEATIQVLLSSDDLKDRMDSNDIIPAKMCNQSDEGLYIETFLNFSALKVKTPFNTF